MSDNLSEKRIVKELPLVDRQAVDELIVNKNSNLPQLIDEFDARHPEFGNILFNEFRLKSEDTASRVTIGALITGLLLEHSRLRVGGDIPGDIEEDAVTATLASWVDKSDEEIIKQNDRMTHQQSELFRGLGVFANIAGASTVEYKLGGILMLRIYEHVATARRINL